MRVIIATVGTAGDVLPLVALARALRESGHVPIVLTGANLAWLVEGAGIAFEPLGSERMHVESVEDPRWWMSDTSEAHFTQRLLLPLVAPTFRAIERYCGKEPLIVIAPGYLHGARLAHERLRVPLVETYISPGAFAALGWPGHVRGALDGFASRARPELGRAARAIIGLFPDWFAPVHAAWPECTQLTGFPLYDAHEAAPIPPALATFVEGGAPPVVFTPGSGMAQCAFFFDAALRAAACLGVRSVFLTRYRNQLPPDLPADTRWAQYVPFGWLLPRTAAIVHHGGIGTLSQALAAGCPQVIMPMVFDQPDNAARVEALGAGVHLAREVFDGPGLAAALATALGATIKGQCAAVAERMRNDNPFRAAVEAILAMTV